MITVVEPQAIIESSFAGIMPVLERAGRTCYRSEDKIGDDTAEKFIRGIIKRGHESVIEHASVSARIICDRSCSHQLVRHRIAAYCIDGNAETILTVQGHMKNGKPYRAYKRRKIKELFEMKKTSHGRSRLRLVRLNCLDEETGKIISNKVRDVIFTGQKVCLELEIEGGYKLRATKDHLFYTPKGWYRLEDVIKQGLQIFVNGIAPPTREWIQIEYLDKNRTRQELAKELKVSGSWLGRIIGKYGLQKPHSQRPNRVSGYGKKGMFTKEQLKKRSLQMAGDKNPMWRGGITPAGQQARKDKITSELREEIYARDDYTCRLCYTHGGKLTLHHIVPVWQNIELIDEPQNLVTLCKDCHHKLNNHEHEYADYFQSLEPIQKRPQTQKRLKYDIATSATILSWKETEAIDTYDIAMEDPHHNFIANGVVVHNSQESQRFCDYGKKGCEVICPPDIGVPPGSYKIDWYDNTGLFVLDAYQGNIISLTPCQKRWLNTVNFCYDAYLKLREEKIKPEDARSVLPNAVKTEVFTTFNLRQWRWVFKERALNNHAQWQIRGIFRDLLDKFAKELPAVFGDLPDYGDVDIKVSKTTTNSVKQFWRDLLDA